MGTPVRPVASLGFRRIAWVEIHRGPDGEPATAVAVGLSNRIPRSLPIPLKTAAALARAGVPLRFDRPPRRLGRSA